MVANVTGMPVQDENFYDREREIQKLWVYLEHNNVLLLAPRRVGKTSLMLRLYEQAPSKNLVAGYISVSDATTELDFVRQLTDAIWTIEPAKARLERLADGGLGQFFKRIKKLDVFGFSFELSEAASDKWRTVGEALVGILAELEQCVLLMVDELPVFVLELAQQDPTGARARQFLTWLRKLRETPIVSKRLRWLLAGSIGLDTVARRWKLSKTIGDLKVYNDLGPFSRVTAQSFLSELSQSYLLPMSQEAKDQICDRLLWLLPYHVQLLFSELRDHCGDHQCAATVEIVDTAYEKILANRPYFDHWEQRLHEELGELEAKQATDLLNVAARDPNGATLDTLHAALTKHIQDYDERDEKLGYLLDILCGDGYLTAHDDRWRFNSPLLRDYWSRRIASRRSLSAPNSSR